MDIPNPAADLPPGAFGDVDMRDTHPIPGQEKRPPMPVDIGQGLYEGATPELGKGIEAGVGGGLPGDVRSQSDGYNVNAPDGEALDDESVDAEDVEETGQIDSENPA